MAHRLGGANVGSLLKEWYLLIKNYAPNACFCNLLRILKKLTGTVKLGGESITPEWRWLCYWETGFGYQEPKGVLQLYDEAKAWLGTKAKVGGPYSELEYEDLIYNETYRYLREEWFKPADVPTAEEFAKSGSWMMGRAGTGNITEVKIGTKTHRTRRNKGVDAVTFSDEDIALQLFHSKQDEMHVMEKSEPTKVRPVVKCGNHVNRQMAYLSTAVERGLYRSKTSTLFAGPAGNEEIDMEVLRYVRNYALWKVPLDQSNFDGHQSKGTILAVLRAIGQRLKET